VGQCKTRLVGVRGKGEKKGDKEGATAISLRGRREKYCLMSGGRREIHPVELSNIRQSSAGRKRIKKKKEKETSALPNLTERLNCKPRPSLKKKGSEGNVQTRTKRRLGTASEKKKRRVIKAAYRERSRKDIDAAA